MSADEKDAMYRYLQRSANPNVFQEALSEPMGEDQLLSTKLDESVRERGLVYMTLRKGKGLLGAMFVTSFFFLCCWKATPCLYKTCTSKTRPKKPRKCGSVTKSFVLFL